jgi:hypothetical protein
VASKPIIASSAKAKWLGIGFYLAGTLFLWDAFEHRGKTRPFITKWLPGG